jgi:hypothetical protein
MGTALPGVIATLGPDGLSTATVLSCDQAVFTSARTPMGEGYRIIAATAGLTAAERTEITKRSPSHGGLCSSSAEATAVASYPLPSGRICAACSCTAGQEQSGRGGLRVYTRALVFERDALAACAHNPFDVFRAMQAAGLAAPNPAADKNLRPLELTVDPAPYDPAAAAVVEQVGVVWLSHLVHAALTGQRLILVGDSDGRGLIETALLGLPAALRADVSVACGLKFSIGRALGLNGITGDTAATERIIRGHELELLRPCADAMPPPRPYGEWVRMVAEYWSEAAWDELLEFNAQEFPDCSLPALERIAALRNEASRASVSGTAEILTATRRRLAQAPASEFEMGLLTDLLRTVRLRLEQLFAEAPARELRANWPALVALVAQTPESFRQLASLVGLALRRMAETAPDAALGCALDIAGTAVASIITPDLHAVLDAAESWLPGAHAAEAAAAHEAMEKWRKAFPGLLHA